MDTVARLIEMLWMFKWIVVFIVAAVAMAVTWDAALHPEEAVATEEDWDHRL